MGGERIKLRILVPLTVALVGLLGAFVTGAFRLKQNALDGHVRQHLNSVKKVLRTRHHVEVESLGRILDNLSENKGLFQAYSGGDRSAVHSVAYPIFNELCHNRDINNMNIYRRDGQSLLTLSHNPESIESLEHTALKCTMENGEPFFGMELSTSGAFLLSYAAPWKVNGTIAGYFELQKEMKHMTRDIPSALGVDLIAFIDKGYVTRDAWESVFPRQIEGVTWDSFQNFVVVDNTFKGPPPSFLKSLLAKPTSNTNTTAEIPSRDNEYSVSFFPLIDIHNRTIGYGAIFYEVSAYLQQTRDLLYLISALCVVIGVALFVSFYRMLHSLEEELAESRQRTFDESQLRLEIERRHTKELAAHVLELELARTKAVNMAREAELARSSVEEVRQKLRDSQRQT